MLSCKLFSELDGGRCTKQREPITGIMIVAVRGVVMSEHAYCCFINYLGHSCSFSDATYEKMHNDHCELIKAGVVPEYDLGVFEKWIPWIHVNTSAFSDSTRDLFIDFASAQIVR